MRTRVKLLGIVLAILVLPVAAHGLPFDLNLTTAGADGSINGGYFLQIAALPTGTGNIHSFAEVGGANQTLVQAYNTRVNGTLNNGPSDQFNTNCC